MNGEIVFTFDDGKTESFPINKPSLIVGRSNDCDIVLPYEGFSRKHCKIEIEQGEVYITDLKSVNGVLISGEKIAPEKKTEYKIFLPLQIGAASSVVIHLEGEDSSLAPRSQRASTTPRATSVIPQNETVALRRQKISDNSKTHVLPREKKGGKSKAESESKKFQILVLSMIIIAAGYFFLYGQDDTPVPSADEQITTLAPPVAPPIQTEFTSNSEIDTHNGSQNCQGSDLAKQWCASLELKEDLKEGVTIKGSTVIAFFNFNEAKQLVTQESFSNLKKSEQFELIILRNLVQGSTLSKLKHSKEITNLQIVALENGNPAYLLKINKDFDEKTMKRNLVYSIIDEGLNQGKTENLSLVRSAYQAKFLP
jgi:pSer/pThr/pTyr-binding forkhead associated (FHA) protein